MHRVHLHTENARDTLFVGIPSSFIYFLHAMQLVIRRGVSELEAVLQCSSLVEYKMVRCAVRILVEVSYSLELDCYS